MSAGQLSADMTALSASLHRVKMSMGPERFAAAQAALQNQRQRRVEPAAPNASAQPEAPAAASQPDDTTDTLALLRAVGIGRFAAAEVGSAPAAAKPQVAEMDTLALIRASGLKGYDVGQSA